MITKGGLCCACVGGHRGGRSEVSDKIPRYSVVGDRRGQEEHVPSTEVCKVNSSVITSDRILQ